jgi:hypothetical protein
VIRSTLPACGLSRGTFYFAQLGTSHIAATASKKVFKKSAGQDGNMGYNTALFGKHHD